MDIKILEAELAKDCEVIVEKVEEWAERLGNETFIYYGEEDKAISYKEFNEIANSIGHSLMSLGVSKGDRVCLFLKNPFISALVMFGIWKVGAIFCPINFNYRGKLLAYQINDTKPKLLVLESDMIPIVNAIKSELTDIKAYLYRPKQGDHDFNPETASLNLDVKFSQAAFAELLQGKRSNLGTELYYHDTANIIYTSGTTGPAKGVVQTFRWMNQYTFNFRRLCNGDDVIYNDLPMYHVGGAFANFIRGAWLGCTVALWDKFSPKDFWRRIALSGASAAILLDVMIPWLMNAPESPDDCQNALNKVHMQPLPQYHHKVASRFGIDFVSCGYGQTEAGNGFVGIFEEVSEGAGTPLHLYKGYSHQETKDICKAYGYPLYSGEQELPRGFMGRSELLLEASVVNEFDEACAPGEVGQLVFRPQLPNSILTEYFGKPEATVKAFRNCWFHTGDACYRDNTENYFFVDRMGGVIRAKGENISSYQLEDIINGHPLIDVCAAFPLPAAEGEEDDIVVFAVIKPGEVLQEVELREWLKQEMPKFMWPKYLWFTDELPRTPTNKVEKYKLREKVLAELGRESQGLAR